MSGKTSQKRIIQAILDGYDDAHEEYMNMSGDWLWRAPEYLITTSVARSLINNADIKYISLENSTREALKDAGAIGRGRMRSDIRINGRVDILIRRADYTPRAVIEIKNQIFSKDPFLKDIRRLKSIVQRKPNESCLEFGIFSFYESADSNKTKTGEDIINTRIDNIITDIDNCLSGSAVEYCDYHSDVATTDEGSAWKAVCVLLKHN